MKLNPAKRFLCLSLPVGITALCGVGILLHFLSPPKSEELLTKTYIKAMYSKPVTYDPILMNDGSSLTFSELVYEGLLRFNNTLWCRRVFGYFMGNK